MQRRRRIEDDLALRRSLKARGDDLAVLVEWANGGEDVGADLTKGLEELRQVRWAILETDGKISIVPAAASGTPVRAQEEQVAG